MLRLPQGVWAPSVSGDMKVVLRPYTRAETQPALVFERPPAQEGIATKVLVKKCAEEELVAALCSSSPQYNACACAVVWCPSE